MNSVISRLISFIRRKKTILNNESSSANQVKVGLALGSGGPRGLAHIGVIKALEENNIPIDLIAGSSSGALIGGAYAALGSISKLEKYILSLSHKDLAWMFFDIGSKSALVRGDKIEKYLEKFVLGQTIESLPIPFAAVATNLSTGKVVTLKSGLLSKAIRISCSIPGFINSVRLDNQHLGDGGASCPVPTLIAKELGANYIIAVNLDTYPLVKSDSSSQTPLAPFMGFMAIQLLRFNLADLLCKEADCTIKPDVSNISSINPFKFIGGEEIIKKGYEATLLEIPRIKEDLERNLK